MRASIFAAIIAMASAGPAIAKVPATHPTSAQKRIIGVAAIAAMNAQNAHVTSCDKAAENVKSLVSADRIESVLSSSLSGSLSSLIVEKGEYETSDAADKRIKEALEIFFGKPGQVVFVAPLPSSYRYYDADAAKLTITLPSQLGHAGDTVRLSGWSKSLGRHHGVTRMGVKFDYDSVEAYDRQLTVQYSGITGDPVEIKMTPQAAMNAAENMVLVTYGNINEPYLVTESNESTASLDDPIDEYRTTDTYYTSVQCVVAANRKTGEIYHTWEVTEASAQARKTSSAPSTIALGRYVYPSQDQISDLYPRRAHDDEIEGTATIDCGVAPEGNITSCEVMSESPAGYGFGLATVTAFTRFARVEPASVGGQIPPGTRKVFTYKWSLD